MRYLLSALLSLALLVTIACIPHAGQPYGADDDTWRQQAQKACERGDRPAFRALARRADVDDPSLHCDEPTDSDSSSDGRN